MVGEKSDQPPRKRALVSCDRCKLRRARCIRDRPGEACADCKLSGVQCESKLPRKQRVYGSVETLSLRYRALDALVRGLFPHENTHEVATLFAIAASRNISMPATDDFSPADIFSESSGRHAPLTVQPPERTNHQQAQHPLSASTFSRSPDEPLQSTETALGTSLSSDVLGRPDASPGVHPTLWHTAGFTPTKNGVPHYFGPSSTFRLATTMRALVARRNTAPGSAFPAPSPAHSDLVTKLEKSLRRSSTNPSDEEYNMTDSGPSPDAEPSSTVDRKDRKRSRAQMEEADEQWDHLDGSPHYVIGDLLPSRSLADVLVSTYFDHVHVYLPLFHRGVFQFRLEETYSRKSESLEDCGDIGWLVVLALVFSFGCQQLHEHDPEQAHKLRMKYLGFAKTYLHQLTTTASLINVQALFLLNLHHHTVGEKSRSWMLIGLAARMAITTGMHRDTLSSDTDPIERATRRQVWWSVYTFEKILCGILGRPTVIDDSEVSTQLLAETGTPAEIMSLSLKLFHMSYTIRQRAYFDRATAQECTPTLALATSLLRECDGFSATIPPHLSLGFSTVAPDQRGRILLLHIYFFYTRCLITRDFLIQKVERDISRLENKPAPHSDDWDKTLALSEDCVHSAYQSIQCIMAGSGLEMIGYSWLDLFFVFHAVLIICADFLARPKNQIDSAKDIERKKMVQAVLRYVRGMRRLGRTYNILGQIAMQFAHVTGVDEGPGTSQKTANQAQGLLLDASVTAGFGVRERLHQALESPVGIPVEARKNFGLDFFDFNRFTGAMSVPMNLDPAMYYIDPTFGSGDDWPARTHRGIHTH